MDKVAEFYKGNAGIESALITKKRIHWICEQVKGVKVLDIGCSQGIADILLARENFNVYGIDISEESIIYARAMLADETEDTQKRVKFECADFYSKDFGEELYDTVIATEVLEHLVSPDTFLEKTWSLLKKGGQAVISVPYGLMEHDDHKRSYYLTNLLDSVTPFYKVNKAEIMESWIILICCKRDEAGTAAYEIDKELLRKSEDIFLERELKSAKTIRSLKYALDKERNRNNQALIDALTIDIVKLQNDNKILNDMLISDRNNIKEKSRSVNGSPQNLLPGKMRKFAYLYSVAGVRYALKHTWDKN